MMAKMGDIIMRVDPFFTDTRLHICEVGTDCVHNERATLTCSLKSVQLDSLGCCKYFQRNVGAE